MGDPRKCPDCGGTMELGFLPDVTYGGVVQTHWHPGTPEGRSFLGIPSGVKVRTGGLVPVEAYRCRKCWVVRCYAPPSAPKKG